MQMHMKKTIPFIEGYFICSKNILIGLLFSSTPCSGIINQNEQNPVVCGFPVEWPCSSLQPECVTMKQRNDMIL